MHMVQYRTIRFYKKYTNIIEQMAIVLVFHCLRDCQIILLKISDKAKKNAILEE